MGSISETTDSLTNSSGQAKNACVPLFIKLYKLLPAGWLGCIIPTQRDAGKPFQWQLNSVLKTIQFKIKFQK